MKPFLVTAGSVFGLLVVLHLYRVTLEAQPPVRHVVLGHYGGVSGA